MRSDSRTDASALWARYKDEEDSAARDELILNYSPLVKYVAGRLASSLPQTVDTADLISYGIFGLIDAIDKFEPERGFKFETYAIARIKGAIIDELRSITSSGNSVVVVTFKLDRDIDTAAQDVRDRVAPVIRDFPEGTDPPVVSKFDNDSQPVMTIALYGPRTVRELSELADKVAELTTVDSVTLNGSTPSTKMSTLLVMPLRGSLRELAVVYWNSRSTTSATASASGRSPAAKCRCG